MRWIFALAGLAALGWGGWLAIDFAQSHDSLQAAAWFVGGPLIHDGLVYLAQANGVLNCWDAVSGKEHYSEALHRDRYRASPVFADGKIYVGSRDGTFTIVKAGPKFQVLATNNLPDVFTASPAIAGGRIYLRGFGTLYAIGK